MKKLSKLSNELFAKKLSKNHQGIINGGGWKLTDCKLTGSQDDCGDKERELSLEQMG